MTTFIQSVSNVDRMITVKPLQALSNVPQTGQVATPAAAIPSSITMLGATSNSSPLIFDVSSQLGGARPVIYSA